jgi:hypothetical protein
VVEVEGVDQGRVPLHLLEGVVSFARPGASPALMSACAEAGITLSHLEPNGRFLARVEGLRSGNVVLRRTQYRAADDPARQVPIVRGMVVAISLVLLGGIATFVMSRVTYQSLSVTQQRYYADQRFADVFVGLVRAPEAVAERLAALPGVNEIETRVTAVANLEIEGFEDPVTARLVSLPEHGEALLNVPWLRRGRLAKRHARRRQSRLDLCRHVGRRSGRILRVLRHHGS